MNGVSVQVFKKNFYFDEITKNKRFLSDLKTVFFLQIIGTWIGFFSLSLLGKNHQILHVNI